MHSIFIAFSCTRRLHAARSGDPRISHLGPLPSLPFHPLLFSLRPPPFSFLPPFPSPLLPSLAPFPSSPLPPHLLLSNPARGSWERCKLPSGSRRSPAAKRFLHFEGLISGLSGDRFRRFFQVLNHKKIMKIQSTCCASLSFQFIPFKSINRSQQEKKSGELWQKLGASTPSSIASTTTGCSLFSRRTKTDRTSRSLLMKHPPNNDELTTHGIGSQCRSIHQYVELH